MISFLFVCYKTIYEWSLFSTIYRRDFVCYLTLLCYAIKENEKAHAFFNVILLCQTKDPNRYSHMP